MSKSLSKDGRKCYNEIITRTRTRVVVLEICYRILGLDMDINRDSCNVIIDKYCK